MTAKSAVADLPLGGGKGVVMLPSAGPTARPRRRRAALLDFGDTVDSLGGRYVTAEDVGTSDATWRSSRSAREHVAGLPLERGGSGDPSPSTALGVAAAIRVTGERAWGSPSLARPSYRGARRRPRRARGSRGCSPRRAPARARRRRPGQARAGRRARRALGDAADALTAEVDLVAPCALGGVLDHDSVPTLRCRAVAGAANNQLAADDVAALLQARGIVWAPDFVANAGGIINIAVELEAAGYDPARARARVRGIGTRCARCSPWRTRSDDAPGRRGMELASRRLGADRGAGPGAARIPGV